MGGHVGPAARGMLLAGAGLAGVAAQIQQAANGAPRPAWLAVAAALVVIASAWRWRTRWPSMLLLATAVFVLGHASTTLRADARLHDRLDPALEGVDLVVTGVVSELPRTGPTGTRFVIDTESATRRGEPVRLPSRLSLAWYRNTVDETPAGGAEPLLRAGERWRLPVRLRQPHGLLNPHGFDLELWLFERGLGATGNVNLRVGAPAAARLAEAAGHPVERLRQHIRDDIEQQVADPLAAGVLAALAIGDQGAIDREGWELFRITGVAHLMSISGLHVTMFAWLAALLVGAAWRRHPRAPLWLPVPQAARLSGLVAATAYAVLAGWGVPAQRTVLMIGAVVLLRSAGVRWPLPAVLLAAAVVVTAVDPWALLQPGFWLSFTAVALLVASEPVHLHDATVATGFGVRLGRALAAALRTQVVATVALAPLTLVFFQQISVVGFAANLLAIPVVTLLVTPLALLGVVLPPLWTLAAAIVQVLVAVLQAMAGWPGAVWQAAAAPAWAVACGLIAGLVAVLPLPWKLRWLALPLMLPLLAPHAPRPAAGQFDLLAADIGQGTAVLVRTHDHALLFDTGPAYTPESDAGGRVLLPLLRARGEEKLDVMVLSHRDADHVGGAGTLMAALPVRLLSSSVDDAHPLRQRAVPHRRCDAGQSWVWDGVRFTVLHPLAEDHAVQTPSNALSCVLRIEGGGRSALLTGDIEAAQEAALVRRVGSGLRSDVLLVPHHGSRTSSSAAFIDAVQPRVAVVQAAYLSRYGHPAAAVVQRYTERGIALVRSDTCGAWSMPASGPASCERETARRYWHHRQTAAANPPR